MKKVRIHLKKKKSIDADWGNIIINAMINQYNIMRKEELSKLQFHITLITFYITSMATILSIFVKRSKTNDDFINIVSIFCFIIPCVTIYVAIIWLDQVYRAKKIASFTYILENIINKFISENSEVGINPVCWEHWISKSNSDTWKLNTKYTFYYICLGTLTTVPIVSFLYGFIQIDYNIKRIQKIGLIVLTLYLIYLLLMATYIINIKKLDKNKTAY